MFFNFLKGEKNPGAEMSFLDHLEDLRWHLIRSAIVICVLGVVLFCFPEFVFDKVLLAPKSPDFITYRLLCRLGAWLNLKDELCVTQINFNLINTEMTGQFSTAMFVSFIGGLVIAFPYVAWELWRFIKPALHEKEMKYARGIVFYTSILFLLGIGFGYYVITPMSVNFLGTYQVSAQVENKISLDSIISLVTTMTFITGLVFELPIAIYFLTKIGIVTPGFLRKYRKHAVVIILIVAAIITPTSDAFTLTLVSVPLYILFEVSIIVSSYVMKDRAKRN